MQDPAKLTKRLLFLLRKLYVASIVVVVSAQTYAQSANSYFCRHITQENGLLHNNVYDIVQDGKGYMWIASANGLQRYDGNRFLNFHTMLNSSLQIASGTPYLGVDTADNSLWISQLMNAEKLNLLTQRINFYSSDKLLDSLSAISEEYKDPEGISYLVSDKVIFQFDSLLKKYKVLSQSVKPFTRGISSNHVNDPANGQVWMGSNVSGLILFDGKTKSVYTAAHNPFRNPVLEACRQQFGDNNVAIRRIMMDSQHNLWIATWGEEFYQYHAASRRLLRYTLTSVVPQGKVRKNVLSPQTVSCFYEDDHHTIWVSAENTGLLAYRPGMNSFDYITTSNGNDQGELYNYNIFCIYQDNEENIWLGTDKGITLFNPYRQHFQIIRHEKDRPSLPRSEIESCIQTKGGDILVGTWGGGITVFDSNWSFKKNIRFPGHPAEANLVWDFVQQDDGTIWAGCQHGYIHIYNPGNSKISTLHPPEMNNYTIRCMAKSRRGNVYFGLHNGRMVEWNKLDQQFYTYNENGGKDASSPVNTIFFDTQDRCWVGTDGGLKEFDVSRRQYTAVYSSLDNGAHSIFPNLIMSIGQFNDTALLVATLRSGILLFSTVSRSYRPFTPVADLRFNNSYAVRKDDRGDVWFTTDYGLYKWQGKDNRFIRYQVLPGMLNAAFKSSTFYELSNGKWVTSTATELFTFLPQENLPVKAEKDKIEITGVTVFGQPVSADSLLPGHLPLRLSYQQNFLTIEFAKLSFTNIHQSNYYYRLKGIDKEWVYADDKAFASYTNLAPGDYVFEVKGGEDSTTTPVTALRIVIEPPFWKRNWFLLLAFLCIAGMVIGFVRWRINSIRTVETAKRKVQEGALETLRLREKLATAKLQALQSQMNPHFIFNCLTSIDNLIQTGEKDKATVYLAKFAKLIRAVLETSKSNTVPCWKDIETLNMYLELEALRFDGRFNYQVNVSPEILHGDYRVPPLLVQPFVENAIHHGLLNKLEADRTLTVDVWASQGNLHYIICDNGVGRAKAAVYQQLNKPSHQSMGMQITIDRINLFNKNGSDSVRITDLYNEQQEPAGTKIELSLVNQH